MLRHWCQYKMPIVTSIKTQSRKVMWLFIGLMWCNMTLPNMNHFFEFITVVGSSYATWALFFTTRYHAGGPLILFTPLLSVGLATIFG